jgi:hypothetical protein
MTDADCARMLLEAFEREGVKLMEALEIGRTVKARTISKYRSARGLGDLSDSWEGRIADVIAPRDPLRDPLQVVVEFADGKAMKLYASVFDLVTEPV